MGAFEPVNIADFIERWRGCEGERANYQLFLSELCRVLGVKEPDPSYSSDRNDYVFERVVREEHLDGSSSQRRIDLYKRDCFVLKAKQSRQLGRGPARGSDLLMATDNAGRGRRTANQAWDVLMLNARCQAEGYARLLPSDHNWPPFILACDVGHVIEVYADFSGHGRHYTQFPDRESYRIYLDDLKSQTVRDRLVAIWTDPMSLDPASVSAPVTLKIAQILTALADQLKTRCDTEDVSLFVMRCIFTFFCEDISLLKRRRFRKLLQDCSQAPEKFQKNAGQLWEAMRDGGYAILLGEYVPRFGGNLFERPFALPLDAQDIAILAEAARPDWRDVDPAIFGTLIEQALSPADRKRLGGHYTPRSYVERLVTPVVLEPLRSEWEAILSTAMFQKAQGEEREAADSVTAFHRKLCAIRILDPSCGSGNFLYVSLELLKKLEGEVLEALVDLGGQEAIRDLEGHTVDPNQFLGLETNGKAAAIAELVLWIGFLRWHLRNKGGMPGEPILRPFDNIKVMDAVVSWDNYPATRIQDGREFVSAPRKPDWPEAEFIVGNPPFIGGKDIRSRFGDAYAEALWRAYPDMNESADFVMYWWDRAAELLTREKTVLKSFGFVTTNSITQVFQRRVVERHLAANRPISLTMAIPDHPWTKAAPDAAAVRIAMSVARAGKHEGVLRQVIAEAALDTHTPTLTFRGTQGVINADLSIGVDGSTALPLLAMQGLSSRGVMLFGAGFIVSPAEAGRLGVGRRAGLDRHIRPYVNGRDLTGRSRSAMVIDLHGFTAEAVRIAYPEVYQHLLEHVKPCRDKNRDKDIARRWWLFGRTRDEIRPALDGLPRYIATVETAKHRAFQFLTADIVPDNMLVVIASDDAYTLGVLSSRIHAVWARHRGGTLEDRPRYTKSHCFDPFAFPVPNNIQKRTIRLLAEDLDRHRKMVLAAHPHLTLTALYNVMEKLGGVSADSLGASDRRIFDDGLVLILKDLHEKLDAAVADVYGWPRQLSDSEILSRLVALNRERVREEVKGRVRWLRPDYQAPRFASRKQTAQLDFGETREAPAVVAKRIFPKKDVEQTAAVIAVLSEARRVMDAAEVCAAFTSGRRSLKKISGLLWAMDQIGLAEEMREGAYILRRVA